MYELIFIDDKNKYEVAYKVHNIEEIDDKTSLFLSKEHMLKEVSEHYGKPIRDAFIRVIHGEKEKIITDIMYDYHVLPKNEYLESKYASYLFDNKDRIDQSFIHNLPRFRNMRAYSISFFDLLYVVAKYMNTYRKRRDCYFELVNNGILKTKEPRSEDYLQNVIKDIDTDDLSDQSIIIDKIRSGEIEQDYYDLDDYVSMPKYNKR